MLKDVIQKGVLIEGLSTVLTSQQPAGEMGWRLQRNVLSGNVITFAAPPAAGSERVRVLPYVQWETAETDTGGQEVISGEFTGCIMGVYQRAGGNTTAAHVCTAERSDRTTPCLDAWNALKEEADVQLLAEHATGGEVGDYVFGVMDDKRRAKSGRTASMLCIASPSAGGGYTITRAMVYKKDTGEYRVLAVQRG
ncbi:hypothetical protein [Caldimonas brevitalea]|uniref:Uncharacterized protein n=1 Tax=Caldimonas brevitalea TaxID=413882 RepID=A0A0G3BKD7_9BURK|nr:hypothetical protein [Caldimonas brevitalea]AKJ29842.1 hypothetical protein AAW51_3151 [Caldimonas brevitalea]